MVIKYEYIFSNSFLVADDKHGLRIISLGKPNKTPNKYHLEWLYYNFVIKEKFLDDISHDYIKSGFFSADIHMTYPQTKPDQKYTYMWRANIDFKTLKRVRHD